MIENLQAWWAPALAFAAGVVSFASPCVLPLVPGYLAFVTGQVPAGRRASAPEAAGVAAAPVEGGDGGSSSGDGGAAVATRRAVAAGEKASGGLGDGSVGRRDRPVLPMMLFVLGFALVFTALGAFSSVFVPIIRSEWGLRVAGIIVLAVGVFFILYALRLGGAWLFAERRPLLSRVKPGPASAFPLGLAFAAGFTPCIGPVLAGIFGVAAAQGGGAWGALLMASYSLGLGLPFILVGLGVRRLMTALSFVKRNYHWIAGVGGLVMVFIGVLLVLNLWQQFLVRTGLLDLVRGFEPPI